MASFDTGWVWTEDMYLNVGQYVRASGTATRTSSSTVSVSLTLYNKISDESYYSWNTNACYGAADGYTSWTRIKPAASSYSRGAEYSTSVSFNMSVSSSDTSASFNAIFAIFNSAESASIGSTKYVGVSISFDKYTSAPTGLAISNLTPAKDSFTATVSLSSWGEGGTSSSYCRELQVWTASSSGLVTPRRYAPVTSTSLSGSITCSNSSGGELTISPNTEYTIGMYASNGAANTGSIRYGNSVTLPALPTYNGNLSYTATSCSFTVGVAADGGKYTKTIRYNINGNGWVNSDLTFSGGSAQTGTLTITGLSAYTSYSIILDCITTAGAASGSTAGPSFTTEPVAPSGLTSSVVEAYSHGAKLSGSISSYGSPSSVTGRYIELGITSGSSYFDTPRWLSQAANTSSATLTITDSSIVSNTRYYYGIYAENTEAHTSTTNGTFVTLPEAPTATVTSTTETTATISIAAPSQGTAADITAYYRIKSTGDYGSWVTIGIVSPGSSISTTISGLSPSTTYTIEPNLNAGYGGTSGTAVTFTTSAQGPTGLTLTNVEKYSDGFEGTVSVTGWGTGGTTEDSLLALYVCSGQSIASNFINGVNNGRTSSVSMIVDNETYEEKHITLIPNTLYYLSPYATNGAASSGGTTFYPYATLAADPIIGTITYAGTVATIPVITSADGNQYTKTLKYSLDGGSWVDAATITTGATSTTNVTVDVLTYDKHGVDFKVTTSSGDTGVVQADVEPIPSCKMYCSVGSVAKKVSDIYCSVGGVAKKVKRIYCSVNGVSKIAYDENA